MAALKMTKKMVLDFFGFLMVTSIKAFIRMAREMISKFKHFLKPVEAISFMSKFKMIKVKDFLHWISQMISLGAHIHKIDSTAYRFWKTIVLCSWNLANVARNSTSRR